MNCRLVQRRILQSENPAQPPTEIETHLTGCSACRDWQRRLLHIERHVPQLPVPESCVPADLASRLGEKVAAPAQQSGWRNLVLAFRRSRWATPASAVAAALLLIALGWWAVQKPNRPDEKPVAKRPGADPLLKDLIGRDLKLAEAKTASERLDHLAGIAEDLHGATRTLVRDADRANLQWLAELYQKVILDGIVVRAKELPNRDRKKVLDPIVARLKKTIVDAETLAKESPRAAGPLNLIAAAARDGNVTLQGLLRKDTP